MTDSERPWPASAASPTGAAEGPADWWRDDADDWPALIVELDPTGDPAPPALPLRAAASIVDAELVEELVDERVDEPVDDTFADAPVRTRADAEEADEDEDEVEIGELIDEPKAGATAAPRPFASPPRIVPRVPAPPSPPGRPAAAAPMLPPVPVPVPVPAGPRPAAQLGLPIQRGPARLPRPARTPRGTRRPPPPRRPWLAVPALVVLAAAAAFFGWVTAEPTWLALGHGHAGTATVVASADGCRAAFLADGAAFSVASVDLSGVAGSDCTAGAAVPAWMVSADSERAYVVDSSGLGLRIAVGYGLVLLCGLLVAWVIGANRLRGWRRVTSTALSLLAPAALAAAMLVTSY